MDGILLFVRDGKILAEELERQETVVGTKIKKQSDGEQATAGFSRWRPRRGLNPCSNLERVMSWTTRRQGHIFLKQAGIIPSKIGTQTRLRMLRYRNRGFQYSRFNIPDAFVGYGWCFVSVLASVFECLLRLKGRFYRGNLLDSSQSSV